MVGPGILLIAIGFGFMVLTWRRPMPVLSKRFQHFWPQVASGPTGGVAIVRWVPAARSAAAKSPEPGAWLLFADGSGVADALARSGLVASKGAGRRTIGEGGAYVSNVRVTEQDAVLSDSDLLHGRWILLRRGRRHIGGIRVDGA